MGALFGAHDLPVYIDAFKAACPSWSTPPSSSSLSPSSTTLWPASGTCTGTTRPRDSPSPRSTPRATRSWALRLCSRSASPSTRSDRLAHDDDGADDGRPLFLLFDVC